jgi:hypothetical protein
MLEALWSVGFITGQGLHGAGVVIFETGRVFGGDSYFYWVGSYRVGAGRLLERSTSAVIWKGYLLFSQDLRAVA